MVPKIFSLLIFCSVLESYQTKKPFLLKLTPEQVMQTFDDVMSDDYIKELAKAFAAKAAAHFMTEIRNQKEALVAKFGQDDYRETGRKRKDEVASMVDAANEAANDAVAEGMKSELDENEALRLIQAPSPDGDHQESSGEFSDKDKKKIPVIQVTKINGIYYRRLLGMI